MTCAVNTYHEFFFIISLGDGWVWVECLDLFVLVFVYETVIMSVFRISRYLLDKFYINI